jgi:hypothetical protein
MDDSSSLAYVLEQFLLNADRRAIGPVTRRGMALILKTVGSPPVLVQIPHATTRSNI